MAYITLVFILFTEATKSGIQTLLVDFQTIPTIGTFYSSVCLRWRSEQDC